jgi:hypothetical protein
VDNDETHAIGTGGYPGDAHCKPKELLGDQGAMDSFQQAIESRDLEISALSYHGNPLHPDEELAREHDELFRDTVRSSGGPSLASSGSPGTTARSASSTRTRSL